MKKVIIGILVVMGLMFAGNALAFDSSRLSATLEYNNVDKDFEMNLTAKDTVPLFFPLNLTTNMQVEEIEVEQMLVKLGYKLNENITPYILLGNTNMKMDTSYNLGATWWFLSGSWNTSTDLNFNQEFTWGIGSEGKIIELPYEINLGYDSRATWFSAEDDADFIFGSTNHLDVDYNEISISLIADKKFEINKVVQSISPYFGVNYTRINMDIESRTKMLGILNDVVVEDDVHSNNFSLLVGAKCQINDNLSIKVGGTFLDNKGVQIAGTWQF